MKTYTKQQWAEAGIHNSRDIRQRGHSAVWIEYIPRSSLRCAYWRLCQRGHMVLELTVARPADKASQLEFVKGWALDTTAWERDVFGGWHPEGTMERAMSNAAKRGS